MSHPKETIASSHVPTKFATYLASLSSDHFWILVALSLIIIILVLVSCSLRSSYFQGNYFITRAKEWVHLPIIHQDDPQEQLITSTEAGPGHIEEEYSNFEHDQKQGNLFQVDHDTCQWVSEIENSIYNCSDSSLIDNNEYDQQNLERKLSTLSVCKSNKDEEPSALPPSPSYKEASRASFKAGRDQFVFNSDIFLTKSESLDEARSRSDLRDNKCFKTNRSVDEVLNKSELSSLPASSEQRPAASSIPCTPKCRKLQERRGSNHSLTIAVKPTDTTILPTVVTPREWYFRCCYSLTWTWYHSRPFSFLTVLRPSSFWRPAIAWIGGSFAPAWRMSKLCTPSFGRYRPTPPNSSIW